MNDRRSLSPVAKGGRKTLAVLAATLLFFPAAAHAMHISEGLLPTFWVYVWFAVALPFVAWGVMEINRRKESDPAYIPLIGIFGAAVFVFSCLPVPIPGVGVTAHPAGTGFSAILIGPLPSVVVAFISLLLQALFLAHGGVTTLGANTFSMGVLGSFAGFAGFKLARALRCNLFWAGFFSGAAADFCTYLGTAIGLASGLHGTGSYVAEVLTIFGILTPFVLVLMLIEGVITGGILVYIARHRPDILQRLGLLPREAQK